MSNPQDQAIVDRFHQEAKGDLTKLLAAVSAAHTKVLNLELRIGNEYPNVEWPEESYAPKFALAHVSLILESALETLGDE